MERPAPRPQYPWLRSAEENVPRRNDPDRRVGPIEVVAILAVLVAVIAMAVWFLFFSSHGIGPGTV